jgi:hypothetical protein
MNEGTPNNGRPTVPMLAVEPVLMFRASCYCGWWKVTGSSEEEAQVELIQHRAVSICDACKGTTGHDDLTVVHESKRSGAYCATCAPSYAAV